MSSQTLGQLIFSSVLQKAIETHILSKVRSHVKDSDCKRVKRRKEGRRQCGLHQTDALLEIFGAFTCCAIRDRGLGLYFFTPKIGLTILTHTRM